VGEGLAHPSCKNARLIYEKRHGRINNSEVAVCHTCDNPWCLRDEHHWLGSWKDNVRDAVKKGRHSVLCTNIQSARTKAVKLAVGEGAYSNNGGYTAGTPPLSDSEVLAVKRMLGEGLLVCEIVDVTGRSNSTIQRIKSGYYDSGVRRGKNY